MMFWPRRRNPSRTHRHAPVAEAVEPRILYSADLAGLALGVDLTGVAQHRVLAADGEYRADGPASAQAETPVHQAATEIAFVDMSVFDAKGLAADLEAQQAAGRPIEVVRIESNEDGIARISETLAGRSDVTTIHLISHGADALVLLGTARLDTETLAERASEIAGWGRSLDAGADILIYGCDVSSSALGQQLVNNLAGLTGADVAASTDANGAAARGGNWAFEYASGAIQALVAPSLTEQASWQGLLATYVADPGVADGLIGSLRWAINQANLNPGSDTITLAAGTYTISLTNVLADDLNATGDLDITSDISFVGANAATTIVTTTVADRVFDVLSGTVSFSGLTISGGSNVSQAAASPSPALPPCR